MSHAAPSSSVPPAPPSSSATDGTAAPEKAPRRGLRRLGLLPRVLLGIVLGVVVGLVSPEWLTRTAVTGTSLFSAFLGFIVPVLIVALVAPAIAELGRGAGRWLSVTAAIAYGSTLFGGFLSLGVALALFPRILTPGSISGVTDPSEGGATPFFEIAMDPPFGVMTALLLSFVLGIGMTLIPRGVLQQGFEELRTIIERVVTGIVVPLLPFYIFGIFLAMAASGGVFEVIGTFLGVILIVFALTVVLLLVQYAVAGVIAHRNPLTALKAMMPAYATALGTSSSAATIPVTLRQVVSLGVRQPIAAFVVPLAATIHLAGSTVKIVAFSTAVIILTGGQVDVGLMVGFIFMLGITMVAAPGVPGGAIVAASGLLSSMLGFTEPQVALMVATYIAIDSFGTATNVTGDGAIALIMDRIAGDRIAADPGVAEESPAA
ncbi:dicarboxylate/amino acid:cation symporter [Micrococcus porci]|uniref:dicarboxylate/amino acid:cation symporter n=1 Tax=Micrococcus porci TaxID=2856555 RepID=UPI001CCB993A|nr:dicarboxylate/amino acid:cation symporter [Micrococcus porci]UBH25756.1 dicarboxylate/amino acid:cation symporter [Micrococcus porci]